MSLDISSSSDLVTPVGAAGASSAAGRANTAPLATAGGRVDLPVFPRFGQEVLPALAVWWAVMLGLILRVDEYFLVIGLVGTPSLVMLWPAGRTLGRRYLSYRPVPWILGIITMWMIPATGLVITETGWSFNVKSAVFFALPAVIAFGGILVALPWTQSSPPIRMFFRPDLLFGDGRTLVGGTLMMVLGIRYLFAGHPTGVDWALPVWNWYSLAFGIAFGIIPMVLMRGMLKLLQRIMRMRDSMFLGYPSIAFREWVLLFFALNFGFAFHHLFIGRTVFSTIGEPGAYPINGQFGVGLALIVFAAWWMVAVKGRLKKRIGEPFFMETIPQTLLKQTFFTIAWTAFFYGYMSVLNGTAFGDLQGWNEQTAVGLGFLLSGIAVLTIGRTIAQHYQRRGMLAHFVGVILPSQPERARERMLESILRGMANWQVRKQEEAWAAIDQTWQQIGAADRMAVATSLASVFEQMPEAERADLGRIARSRINRQGSVGVHR